MTTLPTLGSVLVPGAGPSQSPLCLVGEAPGENESLYRRPFVGAAGDELTRMLKEAEIDRSSCYLTNVFKLRPGPDTNDVARFFVSRTHPDASLTSRPYKGGKYLRRDLLPMFNGLTPELVSVGARVVVALGATALWALLGHQKISSYVGTVHPATPDRPFIVIPTYHPSAVLHQWSYRTTVVENLKKAREVLATLSPGVLGGGSTKPRSGPQPWIKVNPTLAECIAFSERAYRAPLLSVDVETAHGQIRTISFSTNPWQAFVIPFWEPPAGNYWPTAEGEACAWGCVRRALAGPGVKVGQLWYYDIQYLWRVHGIPVCGPIEDTGLAHHALEPELPKDLGFLGASYTDLPEWKTMRIKSEKDED